MFGFPALSRCSGTHGTVRLPECTVGNQTNRGSSCSGNRQRLSIVYQLLYYMVTEVKYLTLCQAKCQNSHQPNANDRHGIFRAPPLSHLTAIHRLEWFPNIPFCAGCLHHPQQTLQYSMIIISSDGGSTRPSWRPFAGLFSRYYWNPFTDSHSLRHV